MKNLNGMSTKDLLALSRQAMDDGNEALWRDTLIELLRRLEHTAKLLEEKRSIVK